MSAATRYPAGTFTVDAEAATQRAQSGFEAGQEVRPTAATIAATGYTERSRLRIARARRGHHCRGCWKKLAQAGRRRTWEEATPIWPGDLYARGKEASSSLCLGCVEVVE